jgi:hypothetical protein
MQIGSISNSTPSTFEYSSSQRQSQPATPSSAASVVQPEPTISAKSTSSTPSLSLVQSETSSVGVGKVAVAYRTTVAGKNYGGTVEESAGRYTASVPMPPGSCASGPTIESAEDNLNMILDTLA